ncbi:MAG: hypothetical protein Q9172_007112, partial [Xanthocarpia lactea]
MTGRREVGKHYAPTGLANLVELAPALAVEADNHTEQRPTLDKSVEARWQGSQDDLQEEGYELPDQYRDLDEVKAPSPTTSPEVERPRGYLDNHRFSTTLSDRGKEKESRHHDGSLPQQREAGSPSSCEFNPEKEASSARRQRVSRFTTEFYTISSLIFFSILGALARLGLQTLTFYPGAPVVTGVLWANVAGSFIMGFLSENRKLFGTKHWARTPSASPALQPQHPQYQEQAPSLPDRKKGSASLKKTTPLHIGLSTGFCGSLTSFSSFIRDAFLALANALPTPISHTLSSSSTTAVSPPSNIVPRNGGYSAMALLAVIIITCTLCISALSVGAQLAAAMKNYTPSIASPFTRRFVDRPMVLLAWGSWLGAIFMAIWPPDRLGGPAASNTGNSESWRGTAIFAVVFAPLGCLVRFYLSLVLNSKTGTFPLGTFV